MPGCNVPQSGTVPNSPVVASAGRGRCICECEFCGQYQMSQLWRSQLAGQKGSLAEKTRDTFM